MKRFLSVILISIYLISCTELHQLFKLPLLVEHFVKHRQVNDGLTFFEFLALHYNSEAPHDADDMQLPFKDFGHCVATPTTIIPSTKIELKEEFIVQSLIRYSLVYKKFIPASHLAEIWQPPKI